MKADNFLDVITLEPSVLSGSLALPGEQREQLLATLRHELRTPMNHIIGYSEMLIEDATELGHDCLILDLKKIHHAGQRLLALVNDLFAPHKLEGTLQNGLQEARHEMRTFVNHIIGFSEMLQEEADVSSAANFISDLGKIHAAAKRLLGLIDGSADSPQSGDAASSPSGCELVDTTNRLAEQCGSLLVVDDNDANRDMLSRRLERLGHQVATAANGHQALVMMASAPFDLVLLDVMMPEMDGHETLSRIKSDNKLHHIPVIMISALDEISSIVRCIEMGAEDYIPKPFDLVLLKARIGASLEKKRLRHQEIVYQRQIEEYSLFIKKTFGRYMSDEVVEKLLESPDGLKLGGESLTVTIVMTDLRGFSAISEKLPPETVVEMLNSYLSDMTNIIFKYSGTINEIVGDAILILFGAPTMRADDADRALACALEMQLAMTKVNQRNKEHNLPDLEMGIGINTGKVVAGNIGSDRRVKYAVVGSNVNLAGRVESFAVGEQVLITESTLKATSLNVTIKGELSVPFKGLERPVNVYDLTGVSGQYEISLPSHEIVFVTLAKEIPISFEILNGKYSSGKKIQGQLLKLAKQSAIFSAEIELAEFTNLKIVFDDQCDHDSDCIIYAKLIKICPHESNYYQMRFTFVPLAIRKYFDNILETYMHGVPQ